MKNRDFLCGTNMLKKQILREKENDTESTWEKQLDQTSLGICQMHQKPHSPNQKKQSPNGKYTIVTHTKPLHVSLTFFFIIIIFFLSHLAVVRTDYNVPAD